VNSNSFGQTICETEEIYTSDSLIIYSVVESIPTPFGGFSDYYKWINKNKRKKLVNKKNNESKKVLVAFIVNEDSSLTDFKIIKGLGDPYDKDAIELIKNNPIKWIPGRCGDKNVKTRMNLYIEY
jgi:hypothetical protein